MDTMAYLIRHFLIIAVISGILLCILLSFAFRFVLPALGIQRELRKAVARLAQVKADSKGAITDLGELSMQALDHDMFRHPWQEYRETLHEQKEPGEQDPGARSRYRSTTLSGTFFTEQALVDTPLKTDFYKHLPGILTGLGIIGTFSGLISGLIRFEVSGDAEKVRASLNGLIQSVGYSFVVSAAAITLAMTFIWLEKSLTAGCYRLVEKLCQIIDSLFSTGAGEEYLARLVLASETSAMHTAEMKGALMEMTRWQSQTYALLKRHPAGNAAEGTEAGAAGLMIEHLDSAMASLDARQQAMDRHMVEFMKQLGSAAQASQSSVSHTMESFVGELGSKVNEVMARLEEQSGQTNKELCTRQAQIAKYTGTAVTEISSQVGTLAMEMRQASEAMRFSVESLSQITRESLTALSSGAASLDSALEGFARAGQGVSSTMALAGKATEKISLASSNLTEATAGVRTIMEDYGDMTRAFTATVSELKSVIETARKEASLASHIVVRMEKAAEHLGIAEHKAGEYLHGVSEVLASAHAEFAGNIERTLRKSNSQFHEELSKSVSLISGAIQDFGDVLDSVMEKGDIRCSA
jgi:hypothetical protein